jgi:hypothetical protein
MEFRGLVSFLLFIDAVKCELILWSTKEVDWVDAATTPSPTSARSPMYVHSKPLCSIIYRVP